MAKLTAHDKQRRDVKKLLDKVANIGRLMTSLLDNHYELLSHEDNIDLQEVSKHIAAIEERNKRFL
jgi:hypothetical protein